MLEFVGNGKLLVHFGHFLSTADRTKSCLDQLRKERLSSFLAASILKFLLHRHLFWDRTINVPSIGVCFREICTHGQKYLLTAQLTPCIVCSAIATRFAVSHAAEPACPAADQQAPARPRTSAASISGLQSRISPLQMGS